MKKQIKEFLKYFSTITKEESDYIKTVLKWDDEKKMAFMIAKRIFKDEDEI